MEESNCPEDMICATTRSPKGYGICIGNFCNSIIYTFFFIKILLGSNELKLFYLFYIEFIEDPCTTNDCFNPLAGVITDCKSSNISFNSQCQCPYGFGGSKCDLRKKSTNTNCNLQFAFIFHWVPSAIKRINSHKL